jgi:O-antigen ligase
MLFGLLMGARLGSRGLVEAHFVAGVTVVAVTLAFVIIFPQHAFSFRYNTGALRGPYVEKNHLAIFTSYTFWAAVFTALMYPRSWLLWGFTALSLAICVLTISSIALLAILLITTCVFCALTLQHVGHRGAIAFLLLVCGLTSLSIVLPIVLQALGEDLTFSGRTVLWSLLWEYISDRPVLGYGYRGFWDSPEAYQLHSRLGWSARQAHNVWIEALLWGGLVGFALWVLQWVDIVQKAARAFARMHDLHHVAAGVLVFMTLLWSFFETSQLVHFTHFAIITGMVFSLRGPRFR